MAARTNLISTSLLLVFCLHQAFCLSPRRIGQPTFLVQRQREEVTCLFFSSSFQSLCPPTSVRLIWRRRAICNVPMAITCPMPKAVPRVRVPARSSLNRLLVRRHAAERRVAQAATGTTRKAVQRAHASRRPTCNARASCAACSVNTGSNVTTTGASIARATTRHSRARHWTVQRRAISTAWTTAVGLVFVASQAFRMCVCVVCRLSEVRM